MPDTSLKRSPLLVKGGLIQLTSDVDGLKSVPIAFQYNPEKLSHTLTLWSPFEVDQTKRGAQSPNVQPFDPRESFSLTLELDATDALEEDDPDAKTVGITDRLAALKKLTLSSQRSKGELVGTPEKPKSNSNEPAVRHTVPVVLFSWGVGRILPVRVTSFSVEETQFSPSLEAIQATVTLGLEVLTPDMFKGQKDPVIDLAIGIYKKTKADEARLADNHINTNPDAGRVVMPPLPEGS